MYALQMRYRRDSQALKQLIERGELGEVYFGRAIYLRRRGAPAGWFSRKAQSGGGPLLDIGVHVLDLTWWLMGKPKPVSAAGFTFQKIGAKGVRLERGWQPADVRERREQEVVYDVEDHAGGFVRFDNGAVLLVEVSWQLNDRERWGTTVCGTKAGASLPPLEVYTEVLGEGVTVNLRVDEGERLSGRDAGIFDLHPREAPTADQRPRRRDRHEDADGAVSVGGARQGNCHQVSEGTGSRGRFFTAAVAAGELFQTPCLHVVNPLRHVGGVVGDALQKVGDEEQVSGLFYQ
jgi:predicted dehydrogenase